MLRRTSRTEWALAVIEARKPAQPLKFRWRVRTAGKGLASKAVLGFTTEGAEWSLLEAILH